MFKPRIPKSDPIKSKEKKSFFLLCFFIQGAPDASPSNLGVLSPNVVQLSATLGFKSQETGNLRIQSTSGKHWIFIAIKDIPIKAANMEVYPTDANLATTNRCIQRWK